MNPEPFLQLDRLIHEKGRLAIMSMLAATPELSFTEMRDTLGMTDGNLTTHLRALQQEGYLSVAKSYQNNRPLTTCSLTPAGRKAFTEYINLLEQIVRQNHPRSYFWNLFEQIISRVVSYFVMQSTWRPACCPVKNQPGTSRARRRPRPVPRQPYENNPR